MDWVPVVSQTKSLFQFACGDAEGALKTQENFVKECPGVSQITSAVQALNGDPDGALETQKRCENNLLRIADGIPVVGHAKALIHYACGDTEGGNQAMKSATRTVGVIGGGAGGFLVGGPVGAVAGGIAGGAALDGVTTGIESAARDEYCPSGYIAAVTNIVKDPTPGGVFDLAMMPVADGLAGYGAGKVVQNIQKSAAANVSPRAADVAKGRQYQAEAHAALEAAESNQANLNSGQYMQQVDAAQALFRKGDKLINPVETSVPLKPLKPPVPEVQVVMPLPQSQDATPGSSKGNQAGFSQQVIEVFTLLDPSIGLAIVGSTELGYDLTTALLWDHPTFIRMCKELKFDWRCQSLPVGTVVAFLLQCSAAKGYQAEMIIDLIKQRGYKGKQKVKMFFKDFFTRLQDRSHPDVKQKDKRSNRGEHVINNGVLSVHRDIINLFCQRKQLTMDRIGLDTDDHLFKDYYRPVDESISRHIQSHLVAHIPSEVAYFDTNCAVYGISIGTLRQLAVQHMDALYNTDSLVQNQGSEWSQPLREIIEKFTHQLVFVDLVALEYWHRNNPGDMQKYLYAKQAVVNMFAELYDKLRDWVLRIKRAQGHNTVY